MNTLQTFEEKQVEKEENLYSFLLRILKEDQLQTNLKFQKEIEIRNILIEQENTTYYTQLIKSTRYQTKLHDHDDEIYRTQKVRNTKYEKDERQDDTKYRKQNEVK